MWSKDGKQVNLPQIWQGSFLDSDLLSTGECIYFFTIFYIFSETSSYSVAERNSTIARGALSDSGGLEGA